MKQRDKSYLWFVIPLLAFLVMLGIIGASMAEGANAVDQVPKLISRSTPADSLHARDGVLHAELFDSMIVVTVRVSDKVITDTIWGSGGDTTRVLGTTFTDTLRVGGRAYFGWEGFAAYLDSALVDSMTQQLGRFAPGGAGTGDIEGVTAGNGLSGGGITGTVTLDIKPGWGLYIHDDSIKVRYTALLDSLTGTDSSAIIYSTDRIQPYSDTGIAIGSIGDGQMINFERADTILAFVGIYYGEGIADSMLMSRRYVESAIGDSVAGKLDGINSQNGITGSASQGTATIEIDWPWLRNFIDTTSAKVDSAAVADSALASARTRLLLGPQGSANTFGRLTGDSIIVDTLFATRGNFTNLKIGSDVFITDITGDGLAMSGSALTASLGTAITSGEITDDNITEAKLKAVNSATDEDILTYESTTGDFEWHTPTELGLLTGNQSITLSGDVGGTGTTAITTTLGTDKIDSTHIKAQGISVTDLKDTLIATGKIKDYAVTAIKIANNVIDSTKLTTASVDSAEIKASAVDSLKIRDASISDDDLRDTIVTTSKIKDYNVTAVKIANNVIDSTKLTTASVDSAEIKASAVDSLKIRDASISDDDLRDTIVTTAKVKDYNITAVKIANNVIDSTKLTTASVDSAEIKAGCIDSLKIRDASISDDDLRDTIVTTAKLKDYNVTKVKVAADAVDSTKIVNASVSTADLRDTLITTAKLKNHSITAAKVDSSITLIVGNMRTPAANTAVIKSNNFAATDGDSTLKIGSAQGLIIGSAITLGTDITDDTLVVDYYPEYTDAVLADLIIPTWKDSIDIYGYIDTVAGMGNTMYFNDSTLTSGLHRRGLQVTIKHPMRVDSLRYIIVQGLVKDSSATNTMWLKGMLRTSTFRAANVDSNAASTIKDYDSLGGDYTDAATVRQFVLSGGAITEGSPWYLLLIARHGSGTAWNWAQVGRIRAVYSRTRL